jgi:ABC-type phosphate/phosphonate transport system substrate-binding protein
MKVSRLFGTLLAGILLGGCHPPGTPEGARVIRIAVLPAYSLEVMAKKYLPFIKYLSRETGYRMEYVASLSYSHYLGVVEHSRVDFGFQNPLVFQILRKTRGAYPVAQVVGTGGSLVERGVIVVRADSGFQEIRQLKGKRVMATSKSALVGYLAQAKRLLEAGIQPERDVWIIRGGKQDELLMRMLLGGKADAVFVREAALKTVEGSADLARIRVIGTTDSFPNWCLAAFPETDPAVVANVRDAVLKLWAQNPEHASILEAMGAGGFAGTDPEQYQIVLDLVAALGVPL